MAEGSGVVKRVLYVYYATAGVAGAYIHGLAQAMTGTPGIECHFGVNYYYSFAEHADNVHMVRAFFPLSEASDAEKNPFLRIPGVAWVRLPLRYLELILGYSFLVLYMLFRRIDIVNLSVIDDEIPTGIFARAVKWLGKDLHVTAHDVLYYGSRSFVSRRRRLFELADKLIAHYDHVREDLQRHFGVDRAKIVIHPFPWVEVTSIIDQTKCEAHLRRLQADFAGFRRVFLLPGVLRREKGLDDLVRAWREVAFAPEDKCLLVLAGKPTPGIDVRGDISGLTNVRFFGRYLTSEEFWALLTVADVVVLPYAAEYYAHSSVVLMSYLASKPVIASDVPLFRHLVDDAVGYVHKARDVGDLAKVLGRVAREEAATLRGKGSLGKDRMVEGWGSLPAALRRLYL